MKFDAKIPFSKKKEREFNRNLDGSLVHTFHLFQFELHDDVRCTPHRLRCKLIFSNKGKCLPADWTVGWGRTSSSYRFLLTCFRVSFLSFCHFDGLINSVWSRRDVAKMKYIIFVITWCIYTDECLHVLCLLSSVHSYRQHSFHPFRKENFNF